MHTRSEHLVTLMKLTITPSHVVSAGGVSFTAPTDRPQAEADYLEGDVDLVIVTRINFKILSTSAGLQGTGATESVPHID